MIAVAMIDKKRKVIVSQLITMIINFVNSSIKC